MGESRAGLALLRWIGGLLLWGLAMAPAWALPGQRVALVVGNAGYADSPLRNPVNDARDLGEKLRSLGFQVTVVTDRDRSQLLAALRDFSRAAAGAEAALFYFAGHGVQVRGKNYVLPVGRSFLDEDDVENDAVELGMVLQRMGEADSKVNLVVLDACRTYPLKRRIRNEVRGLARVDAPSGTLVAFATQPSAVALDGRERNGVFTKHLLRHVGTPGLPVEQMLKRVRVAVAEETSGQQRPVEENSLMSDFYFASSPINVGNQPSNVLVPQLNRLKFTESETN